MDSYEWNLLSVGDAGEFQISCAREDLTKRNKKLKRKKNNNNTAGGHKHQHQTTALGRLVLFGGPKAVRPLVDAGLSSSEA